MKKSLKSTKIAVICCILAGLLLVGLVVAVILWTGSREKQPLMKASPTPIPTPTQATVKTEGDTTTTAFIISVDSVFKSIRIYLPLTDEIRSVYYTGSTDIRNKFDRIISAAQVVSGTIAELSFDTESGRVYRLTAVTEDFCLDSITDMKINPDKGMITIKGTNYRYLPGLPVLSLSTDESGTPASSLSDEDMVKISSVSVLDPIDEVVVCGLGDRIYGIIIERGHGKLSIINAQEFIGGNLYVDHIFYAEIVQDMVVSIPEGTYEVAISFDELHGEQVISVDSGSSIVFDAAPFGAPIAQTGMVNFDIYPEGAALYIDGTFRLFQTDVELEYGEHVVMVSLGGYTTWTGKITVSQPELALSITLAERMIPTPTPTAEPDSGTTNPDDETIDPDDNTTDTDNGTTDPDDETIDPDSGTTNPDDETIDPDSGTTDPDDNTTEQPGNTQEVTIRWYPSAVVSIDSSYIGTTDASGTLKVHLTRGTHVISLTTLSGMVAPAFYTVEVDSTTTYLAFPTG